MTIESAIKRMTIQLGSEVVGIASVEDINKYAPPGHRPDDYLVGAKSVIVFGGHFALKGAWQSPYSRLLPSHMDFNPFDAIRIAKTIAKFIEEKFGYYAIYEEPPLSGLNPALSHKLFIEMAGLGTRSLAGGGIILNPEIGLVSTRACITTMPLKADGPMKVPVCPHPSCVKMWEKQKTTPCLNTCDCFSGELEGARIKWIKFDRWKCSTKAMNEGMGSFAGALVDAINEPDPEVRKTLLLGSRFRNLIQAIAFTHVMAQCTECLRNCPVCVQARTLKPKPINEVALEEMTQ